MRLPGGEIIDTGRTGPALSAGRSAEFVIKIYAYPQRVMEGSLQRGSDEEAIPFAGLMSFIGLVEKLLDEGSTPQASMALRCWNLAGADNPEIKENLASSDDGYQSPALASFIMRVQFRQNAGWQGRLLWIEQNRSIAFRSVLEVALLLDRALIHAGGAGAGRNRNRQTGRWTTRESVS